MMIHSIKRFYLFPLAFTLTFFISCQDGNKEESPASDLTEAPAEMTLEQKKAQLQNAAPVQNSANRNMASGNVNPPHGQPGHRCDIPVGAPLDGGGGSVKSGSQPGVQNAQKPAINPPHGQPFHRCDVKVGDPLP